VALAFQAGQRRFRVRVYSEENNVAQPSVDEELACFNEARQLRSGLEQQFKLNAAYCMPRDYPMWQTEGPVDQQTGMASGGLNRVIFDNTGIRCVPKYQAVLNRIMTPEGQRYHQLTTDNKDLNRGRAVRVYFEDLTDKLFQMRYAPRAQFAQTQGEHYSSMGVYGTACKMLTWRKATAIDRSGGFLYAQWPLRYYYALVDEFGRITRDYREFWLNARQFRKKWPEKQLPKRLDADKGENNKAHFVHCVYERDDYDAYAIDNRRMPYAAGYICVDDRNYITDEEAFLTRPYIVSRPQTSVGNPYGFSPAEVAFAALGGVNAVKKTIVKQGHKAVDPPILAADDGALSGRVDMRPGRVMYGAIDKQGKELLKPFNPQANFQVAEKLVQDDREDIKDSFFVKLFEILEKNERMTIPEVYEKLALQSAEVAPAMGRLQSEDQGPQIEREIALLAEYGRLPTPPPELVEAKGEYTVRYTSPMAKAMYSEEVSGYLRLAESAADWAAKTGDRRPLHWFNWDEATPAIAWRMNARTAWINSPDEVQKLRADEAKQQQQEAMVKAAPAAASVMTAAMKNGQQAPIQ
jgi:hypothetical protein